MVFVDLRDVRELEREGMIPGAFHCPRGMLEFWVDPDSPYHKDVFAADKEFVFYCNGAWRSALATDVAQQMGLEAVVEMDGGFAEWKKKGYPVAERPTKKARCGVSAAPRAARAWPRSLPATARSRSRGSRRPPRCPAPAGCS